MHRSYHDHDMTKLFAVPSWALPSCEEHGTGRMEWETPRVPPKGWCIVVNIWHCFQVSRMMRTKSYRNLPQAEDAQSSQGHPLPLADRGKPQADVGVGL